MTKITKNTQLKRNNNLISSEIDGEAVMMSLENGEYYGLNETGSFIWEAIGEEITFADLLKTIENNYNDFPKETGENEIIELLLQLQQKNIIEINNQA